MLKIRCEKPEDIAAISNVNEKAFGRKQGVGAQLVEAGLKQCHQIGYELVMVVGHPQYYPRFGFIMAKQKGISCEFEVPDEAFMLLELKPDALAGRSGKVRFEPEFHEVM